VTRYTPVLVEAPANGFALKGLLSAGPIDIVDDASGYGEQIAVRLQGLSVNARLVTNVSPDSTGVIFARGLLPIRTPDEAIAVQRDAWNAARALAKHRGQGDRVFVILQDTGGDFGLSGRAGDRAWSAGLAGLAKTAAAEWPDASVKAIDVSCTGSGAGGVAAQVVSELLCGGSDVEVALAATKPRAVVRHRPALHAPNDGETPRMRPGSVIVVSGGARGVTAAALASIGKYRPRLALLGRTALMSEPDDTRAAATDADIRRALLARAKASGVTPEPKALAREAKLILDCREIRENMARLERAGAEVSYRAVDVRDPASVNAVVDDIRRSWGPIGGVVHGAGVLADALLSAQTDEQFDHVFCTKVDGLRHLLAATAADPIEVLIFFSSVAGRFGNSGQAAYAMANEVLSAVAACERARRGPRCLVRSLVWGPWAGGMVTPALGRLFEKAGVQLLALDDGTAAFGREVESADDCAQVILMNGEPPESARPLHAVSPATRAHGDSGIRAGEHRFDLLVNSITHPFLDGHRITGVPVVPAATVLEWFHRAASVACPSLAVVACRDVKVLRGIPIESFETRGIPLAVQTRSIDEARTENAAHLGLEMKLLDAQGQPRYSAVVQMGAAPPPQASVPEPPADAAPWPASVTQAYSEALFHRGPFAAIRSLGVLSESGASGEVLGLSALGWPAGTWRTDVAAVDGAVQIAALWARSLMGRLPLPTRIGAFRVYEGGPAKGPLRCLVHGRRTGRYSAVAEVALLDGHPAGTGNLVATLEGLEFHLPPTAGR
jgi:NAD(P)-dependent dehydrogenase (short-subunit alcohol dehydrogenase family)